MNREQRILWPAGTAILVTVALSLAVYLHFAPLALLALALLAAAALAFSLARSRLFDFNFLLSRTLVYGTLTLLIAASYVLLVGAANLWPGASQSLPRLVIVGLAAAIFQPLRQRLQRGAERLVYGERGDPDLVALRLSRQLQSAFDAAVVLDEVVQTVARSLKLDYVAIEVVDGAAPPRVMASVGRPAARLARFELAQHGQRLGALAVAPRAGESALSAKDALVLDQLARHVSVAVQAAHTLQGLKRSQEQLILAREEERRRLQRELQIEVAPDVSGLVLSVDAVCAALRRGQPPAELAPALGALRNDAQQMTARLRDLVHSLNAPMR